MKRSKLNRTKLGLETLEDRWCPALVLDTTNGILNVSVVGAPAGNLTVTQTAAGTYTVTDTVATFTNVLANGGVRITGSTSDDTIVLDGGGAATPITGNVFIDAGNGDDDVSVTNSTVAGLLSISTGNGDDGVTVASAALVTVQGSAFFNLGSGTAVDTLDIGTAAAAAVIQGDVVSTDANTVALNNAASMIQGKATIVFNEVSATANTFTTAAGSTIGSLSVVGSAGADNVTLNGGVTNAAQVYLGNGTNNLTTAAATAIIGGTLSVNGGTGDDVVLLQSNVNGSATINLGASAGATQAFNLSTATGRLRGSVNLTAGGGATAMNFNAGSRVDGTLSVNTSGTANTFVMAGSMFGSAFNYTGGGGVDTLTWAATAGSARFGVNLGAGNDVFNLNTMFYNGGTIDGGFGTDDFNNAAAIVNLVIRNFET